MVDAQASAHRRGVIQEEKCMSELLPSVRKSAYRIRHNSHVTVTPSLSGQGLGRNESVAGAVAHLAFTGWDPNALLALSHVAVCWAIRKLRDLNPWRFLSVIAATPAKIQNVCQDQIRVV
jgi:hypothetical protein